MPLPLPQLQPQPQMSPQMPSVSVVGLTVEDTFYLPPAYSSHHHHHHVPVSQPTQTQPAPAQQQQGMMQEVAFSSSFYGQGQPAPDGPCLIADGGGNPDAGSYIPSYTSSFVFTYPEGACGASANQRTSSSDQSSDSLNSPSLLALWELCVSLPLLACRQQHTHTYKGKHLSDVVLIFYIKAFRFETFWGPDALASEWLHQMM